MVPLPLGRVEGTGDPAQHGGVVRPGRGQLGVGDQPVQQVDAGEVGDPGDEHLAELARRGVQVQGGADLAADLVEQGELLARLAVGQDRPDPVGLGRSARGGDGGRGRVGPVLPVGGGVDGGLLDGDVSFGRGGGGVGCQGGGGLALARDGVAGRARRQHPQPDGRSGAAGGGPPGVRPAAGGLLGAGRAEPGGALLGGRVAAAEPGGGARGARRRRRLERQDGQDGRGVDRQRGQPGPYELGQQPLDAPRRPGGQQRGERVGGALAGRGEGRREALEPALGGRGGGVRQQALADRDPRPGRAQRAGVGGQREQAAAGRLDQRVGPPEHVTQPFLTVGDGHRTGPRGVELGEVVQGVEGVAAPAGRRALGARPGRGLGVRSVVRIGAGAGPGLDGGQQAGRGAAVRDLGAVPEQLLGRPVPLDDPAVLVHQHGREPQECCHP